MVKIVFEYKDEYTKGKWHKRSCIMSSVEQCIETYGLGVDCGYRIISVEEVEEDA